MAARFLPLRPILRASSSRAQALAASSQLEAAQGAVRARANLATGSHVSRRSFTSSCPRHQVDGGPSEQLKNRNAQGPFSPRAAALLAVTGLGLFFYFKHEKGKVQERKRSETAAARIGRPKIGGPFVLTDTEGKPFSDKDMLGRWSLVYFGFTNCPDICPEELDKMAIVVKDVAKTTGTEIRPIFITCDPARDSVGAVRKYVRDFHPDMVGLTGTYDDIKATCKAYRVYFSTPPNVKATDDYLVDHSIFFYLMDPEGRFVDAFGRSMAAPEVGTKVRNYVGEWKDTDGKPSWAVDVAPPS